MCECAERMVNIYEKDGIENNPEFEKLGKHCEKISKKMEEVYVAKGQDLIQLKADMAANCPAMKKLMKIVSQVTELIMNDLSELDSALKEFDKTLMPWDTIQMQEMIERVSQALREMRMDSSSFGSMELDSFQLQRQAELFKGLKKIIKDSEGLKPSQEGIKDIKEEKEDK